MNLNSKKLVVMIDKIQYHLIPFHIKVHDYKIIPDLKKNIYNKSKLYLSCKVIHTNKYDFADHISDMCKKFVKNDIFDKRTILTNIRYKNGSLIYGFYMKPEDFKLHIIKIES